MFSHRIRCALGSIAFITRSECLPIIPTKGEFHFDSEVSSDVMYIIFVIVLTFLGIVVSCAALYCAFAFHRRISEEDLSRQEDNQAYLELNSDEQEIFFQAKDFVATNPYLRGALTLSQNLSIQERGIKAWEFVKDGMLSNNDLLIVQKFELNFFKKFECSTQTNLPIPQTNDVYYFESKIFSLPNPEETTISIGLGPKPYPWFRLPGRHAQSISYDSDGYRRYSQPFPFTSDAPFPQLIEGDVVGVGYRVRSGTVFFTRNGKKVSESKIGGHIKNYRLPENGQIYPIIGANNLCSVHVNIGQLGYVFIEGNVKKWGFAPLEGSGPAPPAYNKFNGDILLERSEVDDDNDLSERENDFPPDFWGLHERETDYDHDKFSYNAYTDASAEERITLNSLIPQTPPNYDSGGDSESTNGSSNIEEVTALNGSEDLAGPEHLVPDLLEGIDIPESRDLNLKGGGAQHSTDSETVEVTDSTSQKISHSDHAVSNAHVTADSENNE